MKILVVEDNEQNLYLAAFLLEKMGCAVIQARDGAEGLELARIYQPDLILADLELPRMDGYSMIEHLRTDAHFAATPIIVLSAYASPDDEVRARAAGCNGFITKPITAASFRHGLAPYLPAPG